MSTRIDLYSHFLPKPFLEELYRLHQSPDVESLLHAPHFWDVEKRLGDMEDFGVDRQAIMLTQHGWPQLSPDEAIELANLGNRKIHAIARMHPDKFVPVATVPYLDSSSIELVEDWIHDGFAGVQLFTNHRGTPLDDEVFRPIYKILARNNAPLWLHPQTYPWHDWSEEYRLNKLFGWPFETSMAMARLVFSGILEEHPELDVVTHHAGGMVPFFGNRIEAYWKKEDDVGWADLAKPISSYFQRFYADTMIHGAVSSLHCALDYFGEDNLVFGTDYPFGPLGGRDYLDITIGGVEAMDVSPEIKEKLFSRNAKCLLDRVV